MGSKEVFVVIRISEDESPSGVAQIVSDLLASRPAATPAAETRGPNRRKRRNYVNRARPGSRLPQSEYEQPLLETIAELGGSAPVQEVLDLLYPKLEGKLTEIDRLPLPTGNGIRWRNRAAWVRNNLVKRGLLNKDTRGVWALTDEGWKRAGGRPT